MSGALSIWVTGEPVPEAERQAGSFVEMIRSTVGDAWTGAWSVVDAVHTAAFPRPDETSAVVVTGSPARIADQHPWMQRTQNALAALVEHGVPVLGICFGHQLLAVALGGRSGPNPAGREIGTVELEVLRDDPLLGSAHRRYPVSMTHLDVVLEMPAGASTLAATALDPRAAIRFRERAWGVQFHPEMGASLIAAYINALREPLEAEGRSPAALLDKRAPTPASAEVLRRFARLASAPE